MRKAPLAELAPRVARVAASHAAEPSVVLRACDVLIRLAERLPPDEPLPESDPASLAVGLAQRCLAEAGAATADERGVRADGAGERAAPDARVRRGARRSTRPRWRAHPERGTWWFNLGLLHKATGAFAEALAANQNARARLGDDKAVLWNLAISATALGRGEDAAEALRKLGHPARVAASGMPYVEELPPVQVRAATLGPGRRLRIRAAGSRGRVSSCSG